MSADFSTPEAALAAGRIQAEGYERCCGGERFHIRSPGAAYQLEDLGSTVDEALVKQTAEVLELAFRKQMETRGFPDFSKLRCKVVSKKGIRDNLVELVEECLFPDGGKSKQSLHAAKNENGWHIVILPS